VAQSIQYIKGLKGPTIIDIVFISQLQKFATYINICDCIFGMRSPTLAELGKSAMLQKIRIADFF
jgi:hypothetical protein